MTTDVNMFSFRDAASPPHPSIGSDQIERQNWGRSRVRAARACDRCKKRKIKCTGTQPCEVCLRADACCVYFAPYNRGRKPPIPRRRQNSPSLLDRAVSQDPPPTLGFEHSPASTARADDPDLDLLSSSPGIHPHKANHHVQLGSLLQPQASPDPSQTDLQGHYVGPASGVSFLLRVQTRLHDNKSSNFTFGDAPLPDFDPTFCVMISKEETKALVDHFFDFTVPVDRFLHRPTIEAWLTEFHETMGAMKPSESAPARRALLWIIFAMSEDTLSPKPEVATKERSIRFFLSAEYQLSKERNTISLCSVQAHLCQCLWLLSQSRMNHCWTLFGTTARLALAIGLNRTRYIDMANGCPPIELESRRRTFWNAYCLDNYLSVALGRPRIFHDEDIDQKLPSGLDDTDIHANYVTPSTNSGLSLMSAPIAYMKLSRIVSKILQDLYSIRPASIAKRCVLAAEHSKSLQSWRANMAPFLDGQSINTAMLIAIFRRQRNVLNLAYSHTVILTHRPFLLNNFAELQYNNRTDEREDLYRDQIDHNIKECLDAAMNIVNIVHELIQGGMMFRAFWFTSYFAFSAVVVLYVYTIQKAAFHIDTYQEYLAAATRCQNEIFNIVEESSLAARYCVVLEELRREAMSQIEKSKRLQAQAAGVNGSVSASLDNEYSEGAQAQNSDTNEANSQQAAVFGSLPAVDANFDFNGNLAHSLADFSSWVQFESMAAPGFAEYGETEAYTAAS